MHLLPDDVKLIHINFLHNFLYQYNHLFQIKEEKIYDCLALFIIYEQYAILKNKLSHFAELFNK